MSYCRMLCIVDHSYQDQFIAAINDFKSQRVHQASKHDLFYLEGRYYPEISVKKTYLLGIDGRDSGYVRHGNASLGKFFNAKIDLCVGFALDSSGYSQVRNKKAFKDTLKTICKASGEQFYAGDDAEVVTMRIDIALGPASDKVMAGLRSLSELFEKQAVRHRVAYFSGEQGIVDGDLDDSGDFDFFGPAAYAKASWEVQVKRRTETIEIIVNDSEVLRPRGQDIPSSIREKVGQPAMSTQLTLTIAKKYLQDDTEDLEKFTSIDDAAAQALAQCKGRLYLPGLTSLSAAAAQALAQHKGDLDLEGNEGALSLSGLTSLSDAAAQALAQYEGALSLSGLTSLSDAAVQALAQHKGRLTLSGLTSLSAAAAQALAQCKGTLYLDGLTSLSAAAAQALAQHKGRLYLDGLTSLSDAAAQALAQHKGGWRGWLYLNGLTSLSDAAAQALAQYKGGDLSLSGLTSLSDAAAQALAQYEGFLSLPGLTSLSDAAAQALAQCKGDLYLDGKVERKVDRYRS